MSITVAAEFQKWCIVFGVLMGQGGGGGSVPASYGEVLAANNARPTYMPAIPNAWRQIEAGSDFDPQNPSEYEYTPGDMRNWELDVPTGRLVYIGNKAGQYKVTLALCAYLDAPTATNIRMRFGVRKNGDNVSNLLEKSQIAVDMTIVDLMYSVALQATDYFETGDYIEPVALNPFDANPPVVAFFNLIASALGNSTAPQGQVLLVAQNDDPVVDNNGQQIAGEVNG